ncbi:decapping enzyme [Cotia virus SPAn232]|uniref:Decapping enzyme n=2 Tax=Cotia virus TaxID=39444 RepID=H6TAK1_9POXV|nr:decapping enzyme [Cotia virus SPAn232]AFB76938.1 decapping enzyme [Cotia virus SPAn232]AIT70718.1 decapping enzyme [Cotia virus]
MSINFFDTPREFVLIERVDEVPQKKNIHVFAICVTSDNIPLVATRRVSFAFHGIMAKNKHFSTSQVVNISNELLKYMYNNELKEICVRLKNNKIDINNNFEEIILMGGKLDKSETIKECLYREIQEESDHMFSIKYIKDNFLKVTIVDKLFNKSYIGYCTICYIEENIKTILSKILYNVEVMGIKSLFDCKNNDKYNYLYFIYNTLINSK